MFQESENGHNTLKLRLKTMWVGQAEGSVQYGICYGSIGDNSKIAGVKLKPWEWRWADMTALLIRDQADRCESNRII